MDSEFQYIERKKLQEDFEKLIFSKRKSSHAIVLYGDGGVGKTSFLRHLAQRKNDEIIWLGPFDVDDAQFWLPTQVAKQIIEILDISQIYFQPFIQFLAEVPKFEQEKIGHETALNKLRDGDKVFFQCYEKCVSETSKTPVLIFDTVESIRGIDILSKLIAWSKNLHNTLLILASRPPLDASKDAIVDELVIEPKINYTLFPVPKFSEEESKLYFLENIGEELEEDIISKLLFLCDGSPLLLALTVEYLMKENLPSWLINKDIEHSEEWFTKSLAQIKETDSIKREEYKRLLMHSYRFSDFWSESIKRLGIVRHKLNQSMWKELMSDRTLPSEIESWNEAWQKLCALPWIRTRSNGLEITLHDALAELLAKWVLPLDDEDNSYRIMLWQKATKIYDLSIQKSFDVVEKSTKDFSTLIEEVRFGGRSDFMQKTIDLDIKTIKNYLLNVTGLYYAVLSNFNDGVNRFKDVFDNAFKKHEYRFIELLQAELQRFLPDIRQQEPHPLQDVIKERVKEFRESYKKNSDYQYQIGVRIVKYQIALEENIPAVRRLKDLIQIFKGDMEKEYELYNLRANAYMRIQGKAEEAGQDFYTSYEITQQKNAPLVLKEKEGEALMELGYYHRNIGDWLKSGEDYYKALLVTPIDKEIDRARVQSQYAFVQALLGNFDRAAKQVEASVLIRRKYDEISYPDRRYSHFLGMALSVQGEVYRYMQRYSSAWSSYQESEQIFSELDFHGWLGLVRQEMAICLVRASESGVHVGRWRNNHNITKEQAEKEMLLEAQSLALNALELCKQHSSRALPSALSRAGRIVAKTRDLDEGLKMLLEGVEEAEKVTDLWFKFANLIEYVELCYQTWQSKEKEDNKYRDLIENQRKRLDTIQNELKFPNLQGRWEVLKGHLLVDDGFDLNDTKRAKKLFDNALELYKRGFVLIVTGYQASQGIVGLNRQMVVLKKVMNRFSNEEKKNWLNTLNESWQSWPDESQRIQLDPLFAELTELYADISSI